jgi:hypothetical protein
VAQEVNVYGFNRKYVTCKIEVLVEESLRKMKIKVEYLWRKIKKTGQIFVKKEFQLYF